MVMGIWNKAEFLLQYDMPFECTGYSFVIADKFLTPDTGQRIRFRAPLTPMPVKVETPMLVYHRVLSPSPTCWPETFRFRLSSAHESARLVLEKRQQSCHCSIFLIVIDFFGHFGIHAPHFMQSGSNSPASAPLASYGLSCMGHTFAQRLQSTQLCPMCIFLNVSLCLRGATIADSVPIGQNVHHALGE